MTHKREAPGARPRPRLGGGRAKRGSPARGARRARSTGTSARRARARRRGGRGEGRDEHGASPENLWLADAVLRIVRGMGSAGAASVFEVCFRLLATPGVGGAPRAGAPAAYWSSAPARGGARSGPCSLLARRSSRLLLLDVAVTLLDVAVGPEDVAVDDGERGDLRVGRWGAQVRAAKAAPGRARADAAQEVCKATADSSVGRDEAARLGKHFGGRR